MFTQWEMRAMIGEDSEPKGVFCIGYNISEHISTVKQLRDANSEIATNENRLREIGLIQSHGVRRPLANILGLAGVLKTMNLDSNLSNIRNMIIESSEELDRVIHETVNLTNIKE